MQLYLALSCLQQHPILTAWNELLALNPDGIQLTPGCLPDQTFESIVKSSHIQTSLHHGFAWNKYRTDVWDTNGRYQLPIGIKRSVHPPVGGATTIDWNGWLKIAKDLKNVTFETMYNPYYLSGDLQLEDAMSAGLDLAVDISHLNIQKCYGILSDRVCKKLFEYENITEIHISHNNGNVDSHKSIREDSFGLVWAKERSKTITLILESYFHRLTFNERRAQLSLIRGS